MHVQALKPSLSVNGTAKDAPKNLKLDNLRMIKKERLSKRLVSFLIYLRKESKSRKKFHQLLLLTKMLNHLIITTLCHPTKTSMETMILKDQKNQVMEVKITLTDLTQHWWIKLTKSLWFGNREGKQINHEDIKVKAILRTRRIHHLTVANNK